MKFNEFVEDVKRKGGVDTDGYYGKQCMDLYNYYCRHVLELGGNTGADYAKNILRNNYVMENVQRINNYAAFVPQKGDIAVWTGEIYGHVAICLGQADINTFKTIDQNWKLQKLTEEVHNYTYLAPLVFLRPKNQKNLIDEFWVRVDKGVANVRKEATSKSVLSGSQKLNKGDKFLAVDIITGEDPFNDGRNKWYKSKKGNYVWAWGLTRI